MRGRAASLKGNECLFNFLPKKALEFGFFGSFIAVQPMESVCIGRFKKIFPHAGRIATLVALS